jgi:hypothetical protein
MDAQGAIFRSSAGLEVCWLKKFGRLRTKKHFRFQVSATQGRVSDGPPDRY